MEEDELEEFIIPSDALDDIPIFEDAIKHKLVITDRQLHEKLVTPLEKLKGCRLVALVDSCHSGTLLNLKHYRCNRVGDIKSLVRRFGRRILEPIHNNFVDMLRVDQEINVCCTAPAEYGETAPAENSAPDSGSAIPTKELKPRRRCSGFCPRIPSFERPLVVCFSACKESQETKETEKGGSMTSAIVGLLRSNPNPTYAELMIAARNGVRTTCEMGQRYIDENLKKRVKEKRNFECPKFFAWLVADPETKGWKKKMDAEVTPWDPQLSSLRPLNMHARLNLQ